MQCLNCAVAGFYHEFCLKTVFIIPACDEIKLRLARHAVIDTECLHDGVDFLTMYLMLLFCLFGCHKTFLMPAYGYTFKIAEASLLQGNAVFKQIFKQIIGKIQIIVDIEYCADF